MMKVFIKSTPAKSFSKNMKYHTKPIVFLPVESTPRELDYKLNLARHFCKEGFDVMIGNPPFIRDELKYKNYQGIFLEKGCNPDPEFYGYLAQKGLYLYDLGDEGAAEPVYSLSYPPAVESLKQFRKIFLWGDSQKNKLYELYNDAELNDKYCVVGCPGFDLSTPKYKRFNVGLKPKELPDSYILVNTNFGCINSYNIQEQLNACSIISPSSIKMIEEGFIKEQKEWPIFKEWLESIIQSFPNERFVIRPHPTEIQKNYEDAFGQYTNVVVSKEGNVNYVNSCAKLILHKDCSTAMQGYLSGVPSLSLGGKSLAKGYAQWPLNFTYIPKNIEEAKAWIVEILKNKKLRDDVENRLDYSANKALNAYFKNIGESTERLIAHILNDSQEINSNFKKYKLIDNRTTFQRLKLLFRKHLPLHYKIPLAARATMLEYSKEDILLRLQLFELVEPKFQSLDVSKIYPNTYLIGATHDY